MKTALSTRFTGIEFENPFLLASAPPTESDANIMRAFEAGWGGVVVKTIGMHPVMNVKGIRSADPRFPARGGAAGRERAARTDFVARRPGVAAPWCTAELAEG